MRGWLVVLLIVAAAAGAAYYLLQEPEARGRSSRGLGDSPRPAPGDVPPGMQPKRSPEGDAEEAAPKPRIVFEGKLLNVDKQAVAGAAVTLRGWDGGNYETVHGKATSDAQGLFCVEIEAF